MATCTKCVQNNTRQYRFSLLKMQFFFCIYWIFDLISDCSFVYCSRVVFGVNQYFLLILDVVDHRRTQPHIASDSWNRVFVCCSHNFSCVKKRQFCGLTSRTNVVTFACWCIFLYGKMIQNMCILLKQNNISFENG